MVTRVKICGLTRPEDATVADAAGASGIGLVFWQESPRCVTVAQAREIAAAVSPGVARVGVFVDQKPSLVAAVAGEVGLTAIQLHGNEAVSDYAIGLPVIKVLRVGTGITSAAFSQWPRGVLPLLDVDDPERRGGTGLRIDWRIAAELARARPVVLAGGITPENAAEAIHAVSPYAVDVSSGVESAPGLKDHGRIRALLEAVRLAGSTVPRGLFA